MTIVTLWAYLVSKRRWRKKLESRCSNKVFSSPWSQTTGTPTVFFYFPSACANLNTLLKDFENLVCPLLMHAEEKKEIKLLSFKQLSTVLIQKRILLSSPTMNQRYSNNKIRLRKSFL